MRGVSGVEIPAYAKVRFIPDGLHIMLMALTKRLKKSELLPIAIRYHDSLVQRIRAVVK